MDAILNATGHLGAPILYYVLAAALMLGVGLLGAYTGHKTGKAWLGWAVGIAAAIIVVAVFGNALEAVKSVSCGSAGDHQACLAGDDN